MLSHHINTVPEGVMQVKQSTLCQILKVVDEDGCVAMEKKEEAGMLTQQQDQLLPPLCSFSLCCRLSLDQLVCQS